jgi:hypothetical protein
MSSTEDQGRVGRRTQGSAAMLTLSAPERLNSHVRLAAW